MVDRRIRLLLLWAGVVVTALGLAIGASFALEGAPSVSAARVRAPQSSEASLAVSSTLLSSAGAAGTAAAVDRGGVERGQVDFVPANHTISTATLVAADSSPRSSVTGKAPIARLGFAVVLLAVISALLIDWARTDAT